MDKIEKFIRKLQKRDRERIEGVIENIVLRRIAPYRVEKIAGFGNIYRIRTGRYRVIFFMNKDTSSIIDVNKRDEHTYKNL